MNFSIKRNISNCICIYIYMYTIDYKTREGRFKILMLDNND